jgi:hypothetical protein
MNFYFFSKISYYYVCISHNLKVPSLEPEAINKLFFEISTDVTQPSCLPINLKVLVSMFHNLILFSDEPETTYLSSDEIAIDKILE